MSAIPAAARRAVLARDGACWICGDDEYDVHHRQRRREGGHAISNLVALCREHHAVAHAHPREARIWGLIVPTWDDPTTSPIWSPQASAWLLLDDQGGHSLVA